MGTEEPNQIMDLIYVCIRLLFANFLMPKMSHTCTSVRQRNIFKCQRNIFNVNATYSMSMQHIQCQRNIFNVNVNPRLTLYSPDERSKQFLFLWLMWRVVYVWNKQKNNRANAAHGPSPVQIMFWDWTEAMLERRRSEPKTWTCTDTNAKLLLGCHPSHT